MSRGIIPALFRNRQRPVSIAAGCLLAAASAGTGITAAAARTPAASAPLAPVIVIVLENEPYQHIIGNPSAPFINDTMIPGGLLDTSYVAGPGSLPDYLMMTAGQAAPPASAPNLFAALGDSVSWREFMESMPLPCYTGNTYGVVHGTSWGLYTNYHNPAMQFATVKNTPLCGNVVPLSPAYFSTANLPAFSYVVPNECNDMHTLPTNEACPTWNGGTNTAANAIKMGDNWLASFVPSVASVATVIVTWDEGGPSNEHVVTVSYGAGVTAGTDATSYSHASLEAGLYAAYGLGTAPGRGATATPLPIP